MAQTLEDTVKLKEYEVTGSSLSKNVTGLIPTQELTSKNIQQLEATNLADALSYFSGITVKDYGGLGGLKTLSVRSLSAYHTSVLIDGIRVNNAQAGQVDLGKYFIKNVQSIQFFNGIPSEKCLPATAYVSANVLNVRTFTNSVTAEPTVKFNSDLSYGSFSSPEAYISFQKKYKEHNLLKISAQGIYTNGDYPYHIKNGISSVSAKRQNADFTSGQIEIDYKHQPDSSNEWSVKSYYNQYDQGLPGAVILYNSSSGQRLEGKDFFLQSTYHKIWMTKLESKFYLKYNNNRLTYTDPDYLNSAGFLQDTYLQQSVYGAIANNYIIANHTSLILSSDAEWNNLNTSVYETSKPQRLSWFSYAGFETNIKKHVKLQGGLQPTIIKEINENREDLPSKNKLSPSCAIGYQPFLNQDFFFRTSYKQSFRIPSFNDLYYNRVGNTNLRPETAKQYNLGLTYHKNNWLIFEQFSATIDVFKINVEDKIVAIPTKNLFVWSMQNLGIVETNGIEWSAKWALKLMGPIKLSGYINYLYQEALDRTNPENSTYGHQIAYTPYQTISASNIIAYKNLSASYNILYAGFSFILGENLPTNLIPSRTIQDIVVNHTFKLKKQLLSAYVGVHNIFNSRYEVIKSFPMPGRNMRIGFRTNIINN